MKRWSVKGRLEWWADVLIPAVVGASMAAFAYLAWQFIHWALER